MDILEKIKNTKNIHLMFNDKFNKPFVDFLNRNFDINEHLILCKHWFNEFPMPSGENVLIASSYANLNLEPNPNQKIICHSLFDREVINMLYTQSKTLQKAYWVMWGGDLYGAPRDPVNDYVRKNFKGYLTVAVNDKNIVKEEYQPKNENFFNIQYILPTNLSHLEEAKQKKQTKNYTKIQINNSACSTTIDMLETLAKFKNENIKITTILSYGDLSFKNEIIQKGCEIFGDKFEYLENIISPEEFAKHLSNVDILISNQDRQQGLFNIFAALFFGSKIFIKSNISTFKMLEENFKIFDSHSIKDLIFDEFIENNNKPINEQKAYLFFDEKRIKTVWEKVFDDK